MESFVYLQLLILISSITRGFCGLSENVPNDWCLNKDCKTSDDLNNHHAIAMCFTAIAVIALVHLPSTTLHFKQPLLLSLISQSLVTTFATYDGWTLAEYPSWEWPRLTNGGIGRSILNQNIILTKDRTLATFNYTHDILTNYGTFYLPSAFASTSQFAQVSNILYIVGSKNYDLGLYPMHTINVDTLETHEDIGYGLYLYNGESSCLTSSQNRYIIQTGGSDYNKLRIFDTFNYSGHTDGPNMLQSRMFHTCIVVNDRLFVIGGNRLSVEYINISDINAVGSHSWVHFTDLFEIRWDAVSMHFGNDIMVVGGDYVANWSKPIYTYRTSVEIINTLTGLVSVEGYIPLAIRGSIGIAINYTAYLIGGDADSGYFYGYQTVYTGDTKQPTVDPTLGPTADPSNNPSQSPSAAPSNAPSNAPSDSPSNAPTEAPSTTPTKAPSYTPTLAPSNTPSAPPTNAPSSSPTRWPTAHNAYSKQVIVSFSVNNITLIVNAINRMIIIVEDAYAIVSGLFEELELGDRLQYRHFQVLMYATRISENTVYSVKYEDDDIGDSIRFISRQTKFETEVRNEMKIAFGSESAFSVSDVYLRETQETSKAFDYVFPSLATIMGACVLMALAAFVFNKKDTKIDDAAWTAVVMFGLQVFDLGSDVNLCVEILLQFESVFKLSLLYISGYGTLFFIIIPYITNIVLASKMKEIVAGNGAAVAYFEQRSALFVTLVIFSGGAYPVLALMSSRIFALDIFNCGLTRYELMRLSKLKIFGTVVIENIPQMCFQLLYISYAGVPSQNTILSSIASFLSIVGACLSYCIQKQGGDCFVNQYDLQFKKANNRALTESENRQILAKKECKKALGYVLSAALDVIETQMELGWISMSQSGFVMHIVHYTSKQQLDNFNDGAMFDGDDYGGDNQLYHHLVAVFTERLYTVKSDKVNDAFHTHFGFDKKESVEFKVKYHKHFGYNSLLYTSSANVLGETKHSNMIELASSDTHNHKEHIQTMYNLATELSNIQINDKERDALYSQFTENANQEVMDHIFAIWRLSSSVEETNAVKTASKGEVEDKEEKVTEEEEVPVAAEVALSVPEAKTETKTMTKIQSYSTQNEGADQKPTMQEAKGEETPNSELDDTEVDELLAIAMEFDEAEESV